MKILIFSDLHLHNWPYGSTLVDGMNSRLKAQADALDVIANAAVHADHVVFCGDLFHTHGKLDAAVLEVAWRGFSRIAEASNNCIDLLVGNHDMADQSMLHHSLHWMKAFNQESLAGMERFRVIDYPVYCDQTGTSLSFLPYTEDKAVIEKFFSKCGEVCFMHQGVAKVPMGSGFLIDEILTLDMIPDHVKHVFTGHYHQHNKVSDKLTIIGSTMQHNWSDKGDDRGYVWYDTETGDIELVDVGGPRFITFNMDGRGSCDWGGGGNLKNKYIRVVNYNETMTEGIREGLLGEGGALSVEFIPRSRAPKRLDLSGNTGSFHLPTLVKEYTEQQDISDDCNKVGKELMK